MYFRQIIGIALNKVILMKVIAIKRNKVVKITIVMMITLIIFSVSRSFAMQHYYKVDFSTGIVTASTLNVRSGPGTIFKVITTVKKNEYIRVFAGVGDWYIVQVEGDYIGAVSKQYVRAIYPNSSNNTTQNNSGNTNQNTGQTSSALNANEKEVFDLINQQRINNGLSALKIDNEVQRVARIKAQDMVDNNYFSHNSQAYGSPFDMLKSFKISYRSAGENIAGNSSNSGAVNAWMNSSGHRANILNSSFNYTGIGVVSSPRYGKIYVQMFIGK